MSREAPAEGEVASQGDRSRSVSCDNCDAPQGQANVMKQQVQRRREEFADQITQNNIDLSAVASLPAPDTKALCLFKVDSLPRAICIRIYTNARFSQLILVVIIMNSLLMLITYSAPCDEVHPCYQVVAYWIDLAFTIAFTVEMVIKVLSLGFALHEQSYLRSGWNILDFITVCASLVSLFGVFGSNLTILRTLRPLRTMSKVAGLRNLMGALFAAVPEIRDNVIMILFIVIIFAILGIQLFAGALQRRCYVTSIPLEYQHLYPNQSTPLLLNTSTLHCGGTFSCSKLSPAELFPLQHENIECKSYPDMYSEEPLSFDHLGVAILIVFKVFSGDDWPEDMINIMNATSPFSFFYFIMCIMVGNLFATNLFLAVLINAYYTHAKKNDEDEDEQIRAKAAWLRLAPEKEARRGSVASGLHVLDKIQRSESMRSLKNSPTAEEAADTPTQPDPPSNPNAGATENMPGAMPDAQSIKSHVDNSDSEQNVSSDKENDSTSSKEKENQDVSDTCRELRYKRIPPPTAAFGANTNILAAPQEEAKVDSPASFGKGKADAGRAVGFTGDSAAAGEAHEERQQQQNSDDGDEDECEEVPDADLTPFHRARRKVKRIALHPYVERFILFVTIVNVIALAMDYDGISVDMEEALGMIGKVCTVLFTIEICAKIFGMGPIDCLKNRYNAFDAFLVAISLPDLFTGGSSAFSAFRAFRMMRAVRILRRWPSVHNLMKALVGCLNEGMYVALLLLLQIFIFSILGMQLFEGKFTVGFRSNYNTMWEAALTCFVVITGDAWAAVMKEGMGQSNAAPAYFLALFVIGNFVLVNVVVAVILDKLDDNMGGEEEGEDEEDVTAFGSGKLESPEAVAAQLEISPDSDTSPRTSPEPEGRKVALDVPDVRSDTQMQGESSWIEKDASRVSHRRKVTMVAWLLQVSPHTITHRALYCISPTNAMRTRLAKVLFSNFFDLFIAGAIAVNVVFLAMERGDQPENMKRVLEVTNYIFTITFFLEMCLKIFVLGFLFPGGPYAEDEVRPYLRDPWNRVDCVVVLLAGAGLIYPPLSAFRSLRTLRLIIRSSQLRLVISAMLSTLPSITQGLVVCGFIWFVFGILGTQLFKGSFGQCSDPLMPSKEMCFGVYTENSSTALGLSMTEVSIVRKWENGVDNFDNVFNSIATLFAVAVGEGWAQIMYKGIDARGIGEGPEENSNPIAALFFVVFHVVGNFFCLNLIIGILINNFTENRKKMSASDKLTERQKKYVETDTAYLRKFLVLKAQAPQSPAFRRVIYQVATHKYFEQLVTLVIITNMVVLCTQHEGQSERWDRAQYIGNTVCTGLFVLEAVIKVLGYYPKAYFSEAWHRFDFTIVMLSLAGMGVPKSVGISSVINVLPTGRLFRLVHLAKGLEKLFNTMFEGHNLAYFGSVGVLCVAVFFMFGVTGVSMFGTVERNAGLDHNLNFETVYNAMLTLFATSTTEGWLDVRDGLTNEENCGGDGQGSCGSPIATVFMLAFIIVGSFMMLNLFAAVVVELFEAQEANEKRALEIKAMYQMRTRWGEYFGQRRHIPCLEFLAALYPSKQDCGLIPSRLYRVPRLQREEDHEDDNYIGCISLTINPPDKLFNAYLIALSLPIHTSENGGPSTVFYNDFVNVCLAKVFCLQECDLNSVFSRGFGRNYPDVSGPKLGHWFTGMIWSKKTWYKEFSVYREQYPEGAELE